MKPYTIAVAWILLVIITAHVVAPQSYDWTRNTISELAAQGYDRSWLMRLGFTGFGVLVTIGSVSKLLGNMRQRWVHIPIIFYGLAILLSGIFSTSPFIEGLPYSDAEARMHSAMATLAGVAISFAMAAHAMVEARSKRKLVHFVALLFVVALSALFGMLSAGAAIVQRPLYIVGFSWLVIVELWYQQARSDEQQEPSA